MASSITEKLKNIGPGALVAAGFVGPGTVTTCTVSGASYGYTMLWALLFAIVGVQDLMYQGKLLATETYRPIETFTVVALFYLAISFPVSQFVGWMERRRGIAAR